MGRRLSRNTIPAYSLVQMLTMYGAVRIAHTFKPPSITVLTYRNFLVYCIMWPRRFYTWTSYPTFRSFGRPGKLEYGRCSTGAERPILITRACKFIIRVPACTKSALTEKCNDGDRLLTNVYFMSEPDVCQRATAVVCSVDCRVFNARKYHV